MMDELYEYDDFLFTAILHRAKPTTFTIIKDVFNTLYKIDKHNFSLEYNLDLNQFEDDMKNIFIQQEEILTDDLIHVMCTSLINNTISYFYKLGITINKDISLSYLLDILNAYYSLINVDVDLTSLHIDIINNEEFTTTDTLSELLANYTVITTEQCYELILSVDYSFFDSLKEYYKTLYSIGNKDNEMLNRLLNLNGKYRQTNIVKNGLRDGYEELGIESNIDNMYSSIERQDIGVIPYEVVATMFLSSDTRLNLESSIDKYFNIEALNLSRADEEVINTEIDKLVYEIDKRL